ncbi:hypothetical protein ABGB09_34000 [Streptomyces sp. B8F3]|uniref:DUF6881 domain-containing protein n=1 Tax=Streptomyces sp. B8F3 TaxID=3153573 RepID=UPI00325EA31E
MSDNDSANKGNDHRVLPVTDTSTPHPLTHYLIAVHLGMEEFTEANIAEALRRVKAFLGLYEEAGKPMLAREDGSPLLVRDLDTAFIRRHFGQKMSFGVKEPAEFDEHMLNLRAGLTGVPRVSYRRITFLGPARPGHPFQIFQEINDRYRFEARRVEVYPDGTLLWREDGHHGQGTAEIEHTEAEDVLDLSLINERAGQRAESVSATEFADLFERAAGNACSWVVDWISRTDEDTDPALYCNQLRRGDEPFCNWHMRFARRIFPALFPSV